MKDKKQEFELGIERISLLRKKDKLTLLVFAALFIASIAAYIVLTVVYGYTAYTGLPVMAVPFMVIGVANHILNRNYIVLMAILAISLISYFLFPSVILFVIYLLICSEGLACMVEVIQRALFYRIVGAIEYMNVKEQLDIGERLVKVLFNVPDNIDTRRITMDLNIVRSKFPWRDLLNSFMMVLLFSMFLWIYVFINPDITVETEGVPIYTFTIVLYISMLVMPWSVFNTVKARIASDYRDFSLYQGLVGTAVRMFIPLFLVLLFLFVLTFTGVGELEFVAMSLAFILLMLLSTSLMYFMWNEIELVNDITDNWSRFRPVELYSRYLSEDPYSSDDRDVPGTPRRDPADCFKMDVRNRNP